jgi:hypothetical protein
MRNADENDLGRNNSAKPWTIRAKQKQKHRNSTDSERNGKKGRIQKVKSQIL